MLEVLKNHGFLFIFKNKSYVVIQKSQFYHVLWIVIGNLQCVQLYSLYK